jgi:5-methylcytosine-specific restriction enzyme subunit McrC
VNREAAPLRTLEISEWQDGFLNGETLSPADRHLAQELEGGDEGRLSVDELRAGVRVTARSWVGVLRFEHFEVRIVPKLTGGNIGLVEMIEFATGLDALRRSSSVRTLQAQGAGLFDLLALLLVEASEAILRGGLLADYVEREADLPVVRGRLLGDQQILRRFGQIDRLICRFDEHEQNIAENQLLAAALRVCATRVTHESVRGRVRRQLAIFAEVCRPEELDFDAGRGQIAYHRLNEHYRDAHALAWLILEGLGTKDLLASGQTRCFAFLIDMNRIFEMFVYRLLDQLLTNTGTRVHYQRGDRSIILDASTNEPYSRVVPDVLIEAGERGSVALLAVDAKYKLYDERKLASGDVYQGFLYAYAFGGAGGQVLPAALLLYPSSTHSGRSVRLRVQTGQAVAAAEILALGLSIPEALAEASSDVRGPATQAIVDAIRQGLGLRQAVAA